MAVPLILSEVPDLTPYVQYVATLGQTVFPYPFPITQDSDLVLVYNGVTIATDATYTLSGQGNDTGGNLTLNTGAAAGDILTLYRDIPIERLTQISQNSGFSSTAFNAEFNNIYLIMQQLEDSIGFCLQIPNTNNPAPVTTLLPAAYANSYLAFDAHGNPTPAVLTSSGSLTMAIIANLLFPGSTSITQADLAGVLWPQTAAETSAGVTVIQEQYPVGTVDRYGANTTPGTTDMTVAAQAAYTVAAALRIPMQWLAATYLITGTAATVTYDQEGMIIQGVPRQTIIVNQGTAGSTPTFLLSGAAYCTISGFLFSGRATFQNIGIQITDDGTHRGGWIKISDCQFYTNNVGCGAIDIANANTIWIDNCDYWGTNNGGHNEESGATVDATGQFAAIYIHYNGNSGGSLAGNTNDVYIRNFYASGHNAALAFTASVNGATSGTLSTGVPNGTYLCAFGADSTGLMAFRTVTVTGNTAAAWSGALGAGTITEAYYSPTIFVDGGTTSSSYALGAFSDIHIDHLTSEGDHVAVWMRHCQQSTIKDCYLESATVILDSDCRFVTVENLDLAGATSALIINGNIANSATQVGTGNDWLTVRSCTPTLYYCDANNSYINEENLVPAVATYASKGLYTTRKNVVPSSSDGVHDTIGMYGLAYGLTSTASVALSNGATLAANSGTTGVVWRYHSNTAANVTGLILAKPTLPTLGVGNMSPTVTIINTDASYSLAFAVAGTSFVADGSSAVIAALTQKTFVWDPTSALWYHS